MNKFLGPTLLIAVTFLVAVSGQAEEQNLNVGIDITNTNLCGLNGNAGPKTNILELGIFNETDKCCRDHVNCAEIIEPFGTLHSLFNLSILRKFRCKCEQQLRDCLLGAKDFASTVIGKAYFSVMSQCFKKDHPIIECIKYQNGIFGKRCIEYKLNSSGQQKWQFFDLPYYTVSNN